MSREITPAAIVARLGALAASADETAPTGVAEAIEDASVAIAQALSQVRMLEADLSEATENEAEWRERASDAAARAASRRVEGLADEAERFEEVTQVALQRRQRYLAGAQAARAAIADQRRLLSDLRGGMRAVRDRWGRQVLRSDTARRPIRR
jgi:phage shock protein A